MSIALSEQEILRRESLQQLRALGINPYCLGTGYY
jgi:lysyl-tRNA synthetase class 2